jgi:sigma-E factor negative regulatory protein RseB
LPGPLPGQLTEFEASQTVTASGAVVELAYSDGLSVVSLFVQRGHLPAELSGWSEVALRGQHVYAADPDDSSVAWSSGGFVYTLIADAPAQTVDQVIAALPHDASPGLIGRLILGLRRLIRWADPFR